MFNDAVFRSFVSKRPIAVMSQLAVSRLLAAGTVDGLFEEVAEEQYKRKLLFSSVTKVMAAVVMSKHASVNAAYKKMKADIGVSLNAFYNKLDRVEPVLSQALVRHAYQQVCEIRKNLGKNRHNGISGYRTRIVDGNHISRTEHRLAETRDINAAPLPGKSLVVLDPRYEAIADYFPIEDGHASERSTFDELLATVCGGDLWIGDRNFCTYKVMLEINQRNAAFVVRKHQNLGTTGQGRRKRMGATETGKVFEQAINVSHQGQTIRLRLIEVELSGETRSGDTTLTILTNLPAESATAIEVAELYRTRWKIETAFQVLTTTLNCEINTLCYPKAALFVFALALVSYNAIAVVQAAIARQRGRDFATQMSHYYMALEIAETTDGMLVALPLDRWEQMASTNTAGFNQALCRVAQAIDLSVYRKSKRAPKKPKKKPKDKSIVHVSTAKILAQRKRGAC